MRQKAELSASTITGIGLCLFAAPMEAYDLSNSLSVSGVLASAGQCQELNDNADGSDSCRGALPFQPSLSYRPTQDDEFSAKLGFAIGNGLNDVPPFSLAPWGADLEDDVKDINGRGRNHLLTAWYRHVFDLGAAGALSGTVGIIDATDYLNDNVYANDEYTQFMNEALANVPDSFLPGYDWGAALEWSSGRWAASAVVMNIGENADENSYGLFAVGATYPSTTALGEGNYRIFISATSDDFLDPSDTRKEHLLAVGLSFDQELGETLGAFLRITRQSDNAAVDYDTDIAVGLNMSGKLWGRGPDNIGLGCAYLYGGNGGIENTWLAETYYRFEISRYFAVTADLQYMRDENSNGSSPSGVVFGLRAAVDF